MIMFLSLTPPPWCGMSRRIATVNQTRSFFPPIQRKTEKVVWPQKTTLHPTPFFPPTPILLAPKLMHSFKTLAKNIQHLYAKLVTYKLIIYSVDNEDGQFTKMRLSFYNSIFQMAFLEISAIKNYVGFCSEGHIQVSKLIFQYKIILCKGEHINLIIVSEQMQ